MRLADEDVLQRHRQRLGRVRCVPGIRPPALEQPRGLAGVDAPTHGVTRRRAPAAPAGSPTCRIACEGRGRTRPTVRNADPIHTPCAPSASAAATCRPVPMPPAASTGARPSRASTISGHSTIEPISPVWPPASWPCATTMSTPLSTWRCACLALPASAATGTPAPCTWSMTSFGGEPSALAINLIGCLSATSTCDRGHRMQPAEHARGALLVVGQRRHPEVGERLVDEIAVRLRDQLVDVGGVPSVGTLAGMTMSTP